MAKSTIVWAREPARSSEPPLASRIVLDFDGERYAAERVQAWKDAGFTILALIARAPTLADPVLETFIEQGEPTILAPARPPSVREALSSLLPLKRQHITLELPLTEEAHLDVFKVLSSLGVKTRVRFSDLRTASEVVRDAMQDALLRPGPRAPMTPFSEMHALFLEDGFELARLDLRGNDHFVDLRDAEPQPRSAWEDVHVDQKRVPFLLERQACAFCEGLLFCHGYLAPESGDLEPCRAMLSDFVELQSLARGGRGVAAASPGERTS